MIDINLGAHGDLTNRNVLGVIRGWIQSHCISCVWLGTPCSSWTLARRGPPGSSWCTLRSAEHLDGLPGLQGKALAAVTNGNATAAASKHIIQLCIQHCVPCILENPATSRLFSSKYVQPLLKHGDTTTLDFCQYGARWRKRTKLAFWNIETIHNVNKRCTGHAGICSRTLNHHITLSGKDPHSKQLWTKIAEPYPTRLCHSISNQIHEHIQNHKRNKIMSLLS